MKFSASLMKTWMACPLQARFSYIEGLPQLNNAAASFGSCVHAALEQFNKGCDLDTAIEWFQYYWEQPEVLGVTPETWPKRTSYAGYREKGIDMVKNYAEVQAWSNRTVLATEHKFCVPFGDHQLSGIVDVLELTNNKLKIVDLKTGARPNYDNLYLNIQFTIYMLASLKKEFWVGNGEAKYPGMENGEELFDKFRGAQRQGIWFDLRNCKEYDVGRRDDRDYMRLYRCCEEIDKAIKANVFVPCISGDSCNWCAYTEICPAFVPEHESGVSIV
jgi:hypothetical protein